MTTETESTNSVDGTISQADGVALGRRLSEVSESVIGGAGLWKCPEKEIYQGRIHGEARGPGPLFLAKSILFFYIVYNV